MAEYQSVYSETYAPGAQGMIANSEPYNHVSRTNKAAVINFGVPVYNGAANHLCVPGATYAATGAGSAAPSGNVGTGTITASPAVASPAKQGRYRAVLIATSATAPFLLYDPQGIVVGDGVVGSAATIDGIGPFTISNAGTMTAGDTYYIDVTYTANASFLGLSIRDPAVPALASAPDQYPLNATVSIMDFGVMWVTCAGAVTRGAQVYWNPATGLYTAGTGIMIAGAEFYESATDTLVRVKVRRRMAST